jgi:hypothetical protein
VQALEQLDAAYRRIAELSAEARRAGSELRADRMDRAQCRLLKRIAEAKGGKLLFLVGESICWDASDNNYSSDIVLVSSDEQQVDAFMAKRDAELHQQFGEEGAGTFAMVAADGYAPIPAFE